MATLPTVNLNRLQLVEQTHKCEQRGVGQEVTAGHIGRWTWPRPRTKLGLQLDSSLFLQEDDNT